MTVAWIVAAPGREKSAHESEGEAEMVASELVKSKSFECAVVYRIDVEDVA